MHCKYNCKENRDNCSNKDVQNVVPEPYRRCDATSNLGSDIVMLTDSSLPTEGHPTEGHRYLQRFRGCLVVRELPDGVLQRRPA